GPAEGRCKALRRRQADLPDGVRLQRRDRRAALRLAEARQGQADGEDSRHRRGQERARQVLVFHRQV
ncbi:MAG: hypothetical protein AVDCRST_MAG55-3376, partial [uncultured Rubrobacteraceae bacterium]